MSGWTESRVRFLKRWLAGGLTASEIAHRFAARGFAVTRNAVLGKAHRLGLPSLVPVGSRPRKADAEGPKTPKSPRAAAPRTTPPRTAPARSAASRGAAPAGPRLAPKPAPAPTPAPKPARMAGAHAPEPAPARGGATRPVLLWQIPAGGCHFPVSGEGAQTLFCAEAVQNGQSYCPHHHRITHQPVSGPARIVRDASIVRARRAEVQTDLVDEIGEAA